MTKHVANKRPARVYAPMTRTIGSLLAERNGWDMRQTFQALSGREQVSQE